MVTRIHFGLGDVGRVDRENSVRRSLSEGDILSKTLQTFSIDMVVYPFVVTSLCSV